MFTHIRHFLNRDLSPVCETITCYGLFSRFFLVIIENLRWEAGPNLHDLFIFFGKITSKFSFREVKIMLEMLHIESVKIAVELPHLNLRRWERYFIKSTLVPFNRFILQPTLFQKCYIICERKNLSFFPIFDSRLCWIFSIWKFHYQFDSTCKSSWKTFERHLLHLIYWIVLDKIEDRWYSIFIEFSGFT